MEKLLEIMTLANRIDTLAKEIVHKYGTPIEQLGLSTRVYNRLKQRRINYVEQVARMNPSDLLRLRGFGEGCYAELTAKLKKWQQA